MVNLILLMQNCHLPGWRFCFLTLTVIVYPKICIVSVICLTAIYQMKAQRSGFHLEKEKQVN